MRYLFSFILLCALAPCFGQVGPIEQTPCHYKFQSGFVSPVFVDSLNTAFLRDTFGCFVPYEQTVHAEATRYPCKVAGCSRRRIAATDLCRHHTPQPIYTPPKTYYLTAANERK